MDKIKFKLLRFILSTLVTLFFIWLGYDAWEWFKQNGKEMVGPAAAGFVSIYMAIIGGLKYVLENLRKKDDEDDK